MSEPLRQPIRLLVCGSRDWTDDDYIADVLADYVNEDVTVIEGDAPGADRLAGRVAKFFGYDVEVYPANWKLHGKRAGFIRNTHMLDQSPDRVLAFQCNGSRGTQHTIDEARKRGIPVEVFTG